METRLEEDEKIQETLLSQRLDHVSNLADHLILNIKFTKDLKKNKID